MDYEQAKNYCLAKPEAELDYPFGPDTAVVKIKGKLFALLGSYQSRDIISLKCDPERAVALRDLYADIIPGYHLNKRHWNSVFLQADISINSPNNSAPDSELEIMIDHSFALVVKALKKADRQPLEIKYSKEQLYGDDTPLKT